MIGIVAKLVAQEGKGAEFEAVFRELTAQVRANEPGNLSFQLTKSRTEANTYKALELYADQAAVDAHFAADHFRTAGKAMRDLLAERPEIEQLDAV